MTRRCHAVIVLAALAAVPAAAQTTSTSTTAPAAPAVRGSGTTGTIPVWTSSSTIGNSTLSQSGGNLTASGGISATSFTGNGAALSNVNAAKLGGILPSGFAQLGTSSNAFSGSISAASFAGNGAGLSNVNAASLSGIGLSGFALLGASNNAFAGSLSVGGTFSSDTVNSGNGGFQFLGTPVLSILPGLFNLYVGQSAGQGAGASNTGTENTAAGYQALLLNTSGSNNAAVGTSALHSNTTGGSNTAFGNAALFSNSTGNGNTAIGGLTLDSLLTGSNNTAIGNDAGANFNGGENNNIDISNPGVAGESGVIRIGTAGTHTATYIAGIFGVTAGVIPVFVDGNGQLGTIVSSRRYKEDIHAMGAASDGLLRLHPVTFRYKKPYADGSQPIQYGLIAEEVAEVYPDLVVRGKDGQVETVQYYKLDAMLLNEMQKLAKQRTADQAKIAKLQARITEQQKQAQEQKLAVEQLRAQVHVIEAALAGGGSAHGERRLAAVAPALPKGAQP